MKNNKVYIVVYIDWDTRTNYCVFFDETRAQEKASELNNNTRYPYYEVEEHDVEDG